RQSDVSVWVEDSTHRWLLDHPDHSVAAPVARGDSRGQNDATTPAPPRRCFARAARQLARRDHRNDAGGVYDDQLLPHHDLHADVRPTDPPPGSVSDIHRDIVRWRVEFHLVAAGRFDLGSNWSPTAAFPDSDADGFARLPRDAVACRGTELRA